MSLLLFILFIFAIGFTGGWYAGAFFVRKENKILHNQVTLLEGFSKHWANEATHKYTLANATAQHESERLNKTMITVIQLLQNTLVQSGGTISQQSQQEIGKLLEQAKHILPANDMYNSM